MRSLFSKYQNDGSGNERFENDKRSIRRIAGASGRKERVLMMDDESIIRGVVRAILSESGYDVIATKNSIEAIKLFNEAKDAGTSFDVVLLDLHTSAGLDGDRVIEKLKTVDPRVRAILMTADINHPAVTHYESLGFETVIIKPFTRNDLLQALHHASGTSADAAEVILTI